MLGVSANEHGTLVSIAENKQVLDIEDTYLSDLRFLEFRVQI
jgi:hypothetical protein